MKERRAYTRPERKRLIIAVLAEWIRVGHEKPLTCSQIANDMHIRASTKLRQILAEMVKEQLLTEDRQEDAGIAGFRSLYSLSKTREGFSDHHPNRRATKIDRILTINRGRATEEAISWPF